MSFREMLQQQVMFIDGAMGTQVQGLGFTDADFGGAEYRMLTDLLTFSHPDAVRDIHLAYFRAGAHAVETNSFGASAFRLSEYDFSGLNLSAFDPIPDGVELRTLSYHDFSYLLSKRAAEVACEARAMYMKSPSYDGRTLFVLGSIGPSNRVLSSTDANLKLSTFDAISDNFRQQARGLIAGGADVLLFETQQDILEVKAAVMGARRAIRESERNIPIMCQVTVDAFSRMQIFNTDIHAAQVTVQGIGIDTFGVNCSIGPDLMRKTVETLSRRCPLPVSIVPNAGLPVSEGGRTVFKFSPGKMAEIMRDYVAEYGVNIVGGCCGTTPEHIAAIAETIGRRTPAPRTPDKRVYISGPQQAVLIDSTDGLIRIGERLNVRGSKKVRDAVEGEGGLNQDVLEEVVNEQVHELGLTVIDVCMDSNVVDTTEILKQVVHKQTTDFSGAMCLDSFAFESLAEAIKAYPGRPILNSISMEEVSPGVTKADAVMEATKAHWPMYIGLAAGPKGPGATREQKAELARQIVENAARHGVTPGQLFIDMNVFPIGSESEEGMNFALESLEAIPLIKAIHPDLRTVCGVGNLTNGLAKKPYMRLVLTSVWLDEARKRGLDAAIINPNFYVFVDNIEQAHYDLALKVILERDMDAYAALETIAAEKSGIVVERRTNYDNLPIEEAICEKIKDGYKQREHGSVEAAGRTYKYADRIVLQVAKAIETHEPLTFINQYLMKAMNELGDGFAQGDVSLPHLLKSADVMKQVMGFLEEYMRVSTGADMHAAIEYKGVIVLGTVYQDVHSIGKDLAKTLFENYGYRVIDLGVMTPLQQFLDAAREHNATAIGMSALLVQTSNHMITVSKMSKEQGLEHLPILIGGAPVSHRHAAYVAMAGDGGMEHMRDNVFYCATAMDGVNVMNALQDTQGREALLAKNRHRLSREFEKAEKRAVEDDELRRTLPHRTISFEKHLLPPKPCFAYETVSYSLKEFKEHIDTKTLFALNWKFGGTASRTKQGETREKLEALFEQWIEHASHHQWIIPMGVFGVFPCYAENDTLVVCDPEEPEAELARFAFDRVIGSGRKDTISGAQYFLPKNGKARDVVGLQIATSGPHVDQYVNKFRLEGDSESCLYLQGLSDRVAEDMAEYLHSEVRRRLGFEPHHGVRWSPGYPAISNTDYNRQILELLHATDLIGVKITEAGEFSPTGATAALVCFHPDARYT